MVKKTLKRVQKILGTVSQYESGQNIFELADGIDMSDYFTSILVPQDIEIVIPHFPHSSRKIIS